jgi:hypothetical protein
MSESELKLKIGQLMATIQLLCSTKDVADEIASCLTPRMGNVADSAKLDEIMVRHMHLLDSERKPPSGI